jgi:MSHA pilin protein MshC
MNRASGFSLLELTAVLIVLGVLLVIAAPRLDAGRGVRELGFAEQVLSDLRFAQRRAEADRCEVRVAVTSGAVTIAQRSALCSGAFNRPLAGIGPDGTTPGGSPPEGLALSASPGVFYFDGAGRVVDSVGGTPVDVSITVGMRQIDLTGATGYASY